MKTTKHTPGQWEACGCTVYEVDKWEAGNNLGGRQIARCYPDPEEHPYEMPSEIDASNARLIAAAPDLLNALEVAKATIERLHRHAPGSANGTLDVINAAIAKAEGEN